MAPDKNDGSPRNQVKPKVSIGMPVYNGEQFIRKALESLLAQTFKDFELVISDNASIDKTEDICREYYVRDERICYIRQHKNTGAARNFFFVLDQAHGDYFMWAAADDLWDPEYIEKCVKCLDHIPDIYIAFTKYRVLSRQFPKLFKMEKFPDMSFLWTDDVFDRVSKFVLMDESSSHKANAIYGLWRVEMARRVKRYFEAYAASPGLDIAMLTYALIHGKFFQLPEVLFYKTYKRYPPGYFLDKLLMRVARVLKRSHPMPQEMLLGSLNDNISLLRKLLSELDMERSEGLISSQSNRIIKKIKELYRLDVYIEDGEFRIGK